MNNGKTMRPVATHRSDNITILRRLGKLAERKQLRLHLEDDGKAIKIMLLMPNNSIFKQMSSMKEAEEFISRW